MGVGFWMMGTIALSLGGPPQDTQPDASLILVQAPNARLACICAQACRGQLGSGLTRLPDGRRLTCGNINEEVIYDNQKSCDCSNPSTWGQRHLSPSGRPVMPGRESPNH